MSLHLGNTAPDFEANTTEGRTSFHDWIGDGWAVLFSHPADFTPVCTTELGETARLKDEFAKRNCKVIAISVDPVEDHKAWCGDIEETQGHAVNFPIIGDEDRRVSQLYDMLHSGEGDSSTVRSVFLIDPNKKIRMTLTYPKSAGRNFDEILRVIDSIQLTDGYKVATPVNWRNGDDVIILPTLSDDEAKRHFPDGWKAVKPYLRVTRQPNR
ncbi:peroxiredoxin [Marinimicrobium koreense]|jgi:alkyl hydroperoxide reductase subunit AhpC|uniref:peroxiredoxin n=1 Tax=Marinimicrobium koreense TaxID=306545 RepID=UPI003F6E7B2A